MPLINNLPTLITTSNSDITSLASIQETISQTLAAKPPMELKPDEYNKIQEAYVKAYELGCITILKTLIVFMTRLQKEKRVPYHAFNITSQGYTSRTSANSRTIDFVNALYVTMNHKPTEEFLSKLCDEDLNDIIKHCPCNDSTKQNLEKIATSIIQKIKSERAPNTKKLKICVFMGAASGNDSQFEQAAKDLGKAIVARGHAVVYGGGNAGLMGALADSVLEEKGGEITGVIPTFLHEIEGHKKVTMIHCNDIEERIKKMLEISDVFIGLPGGFGTQEEMLKVINAAKLGLHTKPIGFLNIANFYDLLLQFFEQTTQAGFTKKAANKLYHASPSVEALLDLLIPAKKIEAKKETVSQAFFSPPSTVSTNSGTATQVPTPFGG